MISGVLYSLLAALGDILGGLLIVTPFDPERQRSRRLLAALVAFGGGFMLAAAVLEMLPESRS